MGITAFNDLIAVTGSGQTLPISDLLAGILPGHIYGLGTSNNASDATNDIDVAAGSCADSTGKVLIALSSALTKRLDATWAVGTGNGGRMSAAAITDTTYHLHAIWGAGVGADVGFDVSATAPTLPTGYTHFRRIWSVRRAAGVLVPYRQFGDVCQLVTAEAPYSSASARADAVLAIGTPLGIRVRPDLILSTSVASGTINISILVGDGDASAALRQAWQWFTSTTLLQTNVPLVIMTDLSAQIRLWVAIVSGALNTCQLRLHGWTDTRGRTD